METETLNLKQTHTWDEKKIKSQKHTQLKAQNLNRNYGALTKRKDKQNMSNFAGFTWD